jgi:hypothetical protein
MSSPPAPQAARNLPGLLLGLRNAGFSGGVAVSGCPDGTIHLRDGLVVAVETPGAPTAEAMLLRTRRVSEADWETARAAGSASGDLGAALLADGLVGAAELDMVRTSALFDGAFAMALSPPGDWEVDATATAPLLAAAQGIEPLRLTDETARRLGLLNQLWGPPATFAKARIRPSSRAGSGAVHLSPRYQDILLSADGRRTPRDIAFLLGRGVYAVMLDLTRLDARRLIERDPPRGPTPAGAVARRRNPATTTGGGPKPPTATGGVEELPRRSPGNRPRDPRGAAASAPQQVRAGAASAPQQVRAGAAVSILRRIRTDLFNTTGRSADKSPWAERATDDVHKAAE